jgi:WXXGXW repeat (2 copies)
MRIQTILRLITLILLMSFSLAPSPASAQIAVGVSVGFAPPELPVYDQPVCPGDDYIWTPGYWAWDGEDYYWVPGTWVLAPEPGFLWTPGYWAWGGSGFVFTVGYWGPVVGFYGGINYGFGYFGHGFEGGRWDHGHFFYNRAVANVNVNIIHNTYETRVENVTVNRVSYNGGDGGVVARATPAEEAAARERHIGPVAAQTQHEQAARADRSLRASVNHGKPPVAATARPGEFKGSGVVEAREGGAVHTPNERTENNANRPNNAVHVKDLPPLEHMAAPNSGDAQLDQKYQKQQDKLAAQQEKDRQKLQQQQEKEDQKMEKQRADDAKRQAIEQRHQQQTQQMVQRHTQQRQQLQQRQQPRPAPARPSKPH